MHFQTETTLALTPIRRVVTGDDAQGRSRIIWDGPAPGTHETFDGYGHTELWVWGRTPPPLDGTEDGGMWDDEFPGPIDGGHLRVVQRPGKSKQSPPNEPYTPPHAHGRTWDLGGEGNTANQPLEERMWSRGGGNNYNRSHMHKTRTVDYGILLTGTRVMELDDGSHITLRPGDVVADWRVAPVGLSGGWSDGLRHV